MSTDTARRRYRRTPQRVGRSSRLILQATVAGDAEALYMSVAIDARYPAPAAVKIGSVTFDATCHPR